MKKDKKIIAIGPMYAQDMKNAGGVTVLFEQFLEDLRELEVTHLPINSNKNCYKNIAETFFVVMKEFVKNIRKYDHISLHGTANHYILIAPFVVFIAKLFGKTVDLRKFAGNFNEVYENSDPIRKMLIKYVLKNADISYFETKYLVAYFKPMNPHTYWFPNVRRRPADVSPKKEFSKRFAFISHVKEEKGMDDLLEAVKMLDPSYTVDIYGPAHEAKYTKEYIAKFGATYHGPLSPTEVIETLKKYDVLVLPSHREGYPGILIEAYSVGRPVLATALPSIREIVTEEETGILVETKNPTSIYEGFLKFNSANYEEMSQKAFDAFENFDSKPQTIKYLNSLS